MLDLDEALVVPPVGGAAPVRQLRVGGVLIGVTGRIRPEDGVVELVQPLLVGGRHRGWVEVRPGGLCGEDEQVVAVWRGVGRR